MYSTDGELIDTVDISGTPTGTTTRAQVHRLGLWHRSVHVWVRTPDGQLVFQQRSALKDSHPGKWDISVGGHVGAGDEPLGAALREVMEELGLAVERNDLEYLFPIVQTYDDSQRDFHDRELVSVFLLRPPFCLSQLSPSPHEIIGLRQVEARHLPDLDIEQFVPHADEYRMLFSVLTASSHA